MVSTIITILGYVANAIGIVKSAGVNIGPVGNEVLNVLNDSQVEYANFEAGQAVVVATFTEKGSPGTLIAVKNGGPAAASLGL